MNHFRRSPKLETFYQKLKTTSLLHHSSVMPEAWYFSEKRRYHHKLQKLLLKSWSDPINRLWRVPLIQDENIHHQKIIMKFYPRTTTTIKKTTTIIFFFQLPTAIKKPKFANNTYFYKTEEQLVKFYQAACFFPIKSTCVSEIREGYYKWWTGLNVTNKAKYIQIKNTMAKGHLNQKRQGHRSTKNTIEPHDQKQETYNEKTHEVYI